ncbi:hypothetical protein N9D34_00760 [Salibacteraceae bacterium]|nr:hypothetical protein [Salibacteraceae bacterium]
MTRLVAIFGLIGVLGSCSENPNEKPIQQVDSLLTVVTVVQSKLAELSPEDYSNLVDTIKQDVQFIQSQYPDTMDLQTALKVDYYYRTIKSVHKFSETYVSQNSELNYTQGQLNNLKKDLENNLFDKESFLEVFPAESKAVARHKESVGNIKAWHESIGSSYYRHKAGIDSLIVFIKESAEK